VYGAELPMLTATYVGFANGDVPADLDTPVVLATTATATSDVGVYPIGASAASDPNYTITYASGTLASQREALAPKRQREDAILAAPDDPQSEQQDVSLRVPPEQVAALSRMGQAQVQEFCTKLGMTFTEGASLRYRAPDFLGARNPVKNSLRLARSLEGPQDSAAQAPPALAATAPAPARPSSGLPMRVPVLVVRFFPTRGDFIDRSVTGDWGAPLAETRDKTDQLTGEAIAALREGSRYHGYKDKDAVPSLDYQVLGTVEFLEARTGGPMAAGASNA
jgi:hypothetical protein